jgi:hypothetical protein
VFWPLKSNFKISGVPTDSQVPILGVWKSSSHCSKSRVTTLTVRAFAPLEVVPRFSWVAPCCLLPCCTSLSRLVAHVALLLAPCSSWFAIHDLLFMPYFFALLVIGPCCFAITHSYLPYSGTSYPPLLFCHLTTRCRALLLCLVNWYSLLILLCKWKSSEQHQQVSSNNKGIFFP